MAGLREGWRCTDVGINVGVGEVRRGKKLIEMRSFFFARVCVDIKIPYIIFWTGAILHLTSDFLIYYILMNNFFYNLINISLKQKFFQQNPILKNFLKNFIKY